MTPPAPAARAFAAALLAAVTVMVPSACGGGTGDDTAPLTHAGTAACARCHRAEYELWRGTDHDLAMQEVSENTVLGDFDGAQLEHFGVTTTFRRRGDDFIVHTDGPDGELHDYAVRYVFGVHPLQQYLLELPGGRLQAFGICWDSRPAAAGGQRWFHLYPDEAIPHDDELHWTSRNQNWNYMCAACHSTGLRKGYDPEHDRYHTTWAELDVACEACHGPGSRHVAWAEAGAQGGDSGIVASRPAPHTWQHLGGAATASRQPAPSGHREIETCAPCHSRRAILDEDTLPGQPLLDGYRVSLLDEGLYHAGGQIEGEVYVYGSFAQSKMYRAGVTCSDCHDPHGLSLRAEGNALCTRCHDAATFDRREHHFHPPGSLGAACVNCHMPARTYMIVDPRRDHSLRIPRPDLTAAYGTPNACNGCHADHDAAWAAKAIAAAHPDYVPRPHWTPALAAGRRGDATAAPLLAAVAADPDRPAIVRGTAFDLLARYPGRELTDALRTAVAASEPLVRLGALRAIESLPLDARVPLAGPFLRDPVRAVRTEAARLLDAVADRGLPAELSAPFEAARRELVAFEQTNADQSWAHVNLGLLAAERHHPEQAEACYRQALRLDPRSVRARVNLADLYRQQGRDDDGERLLREGLTWYGDSAELHHALGLLLVRRGQAADAVRHLELAARARPDNPRFGYVYAVALHDTGDVAGSMHALEGVHRRHPTDREVLLGLATYEREAGHPRRALQWAEKLQALVPDDRGIVQLVDDLRRRASGQAPR